MDRPQVRRRRTWVKGVVLGVSCVVALPFLIPSVKRWSVVEESVRRSRIRSARVTRGDLVRDVAVQGRTVAADHPTLYGPARGIISLRVRAGEVAAEGQVLAVIESPELENAHEQEGSGLLSMRSDLEGLRISTRREGLENQQAVDLAGIKQEAAERELLRAERSFEEGLIMELDYEKAQDDRRIAALEHKHASQSAALALESFEYVVRQKELEVGRQELVLAEARRRLDELVIRAPFGGLVANLSVEDREAIQPNQALLTVVDLSSFEVEIDVPESYADDVLPGSEAQLRIGGEVYPGRVVRIAPEVSRAQVLGSVVFVGEPPPGLRQNQRVSVRLILDRRTDVLKVQRGPFLESLGGRRVYLIQEGVATLTEVEIGAISVSEVEILDGLEEESEIVLSDMTLYDGASSILIVE